MDAYDDGEQILKNEEEKDRREYMASGKETISVLFIGKLGIGKSSLVNGLMKKKVAEEGGGAASVTSQIQSYERTIDIEEIGKTVKVKMWDTPGLSDAFASEDQLTPEHIKNMDLVLYCFDMTRRFEKSDLEEMQNFSRKAGEGIWQHTMFVLTFANRVVPNDPQTDSEQHFLTILNSWISQLQKVMKEKMQFPQKIAKEIPIVPTGYGNNSPPDREEWFTPFWTEALARMKQDAQPTMVAMFADRIEETENCTGQAKDPEDKKIYVNKTFPTYKVALGVGATVTVGFSTLTGAAIGAGIGSVLGPVGIGVGAGVGAAVGFLGSVGIISVGATIRDLIKKHKWKKRGKND